MALDTQRETEHKDVLKSFRSGSSIDAIIPRMSLIDQFDEVDETIKRSGEPHLETKPVRSRDFVLNSIDRKHIIPVTRLILRRQGLDTEENIIPYDVYSTKK